MQKNVQNKEIRQMCEDDFLLTKIYRFVLCFRFKLISLL